MDRFNQKGKTGRITDETAKSINEYSCQSTLLVAFIIAYTYELLGNFFGE